MNRIFSLIKATMTDNMNIFRIKNKKQTESSKKILPIVLFGIIFYVVWNYANMYMEQLNKFNMEFVGLTIFIFATTIITLIEGIYKSGNLLFNCKDDDLLFALPIKKGTVLFVRVFKFYIFELIYNSMFLVPAMVAYIKWVNVSPIYYLVSILGVILFPMIPISISCIIGMVISSISSKFKKKNIAQIICTFVFLIGILYVSFNLEGLLIKLAENATSINDMITKIYYPAGLYIKLITNFNIQDLLIFIGSQILIFGFIIFILSKVYFKINSSIKKINIGTNNKYYKIKTHKPIIALIKKELGKFLTSPVFVTNAGFGLVLFVLGCIIISLKFDNVVIPISNQFGITIEQIKSYIPLALFGFIVLSSFMTSITSSMISLEGKSFSILKSLPLNPYTIVKSKILTALLIMIPFIIIGDIIVIARFGCNKLEFIMILLTSIILPAVAETIGIIVNLKYPKMDATNDTEVVKQSMSSTIAVFLGMILIVITLLGIFKLVSINVKIDLIMAIILGIYILLYIGLITYLKNIVTSKFNKINV